MGGAVLMPGFLMDGLEMAFPLITMEHDVQSRDRKLVLFELGVGFNTPTIIRFPFEKLTREHDNITLVRLNLDQAVIPESLGNRAIGINADMAESISDILNVSVSHPYPVQGQ